MCSMKSRSVVRWFDTFHETDTAITFANVDVARCEDGEFDGLAVASAFMEDFLGHRCR